MPARIDLVGGAKAREHLRAGWSVERRGRKWPASVALQLTRDDLEILIAIFGTQSDREPGGHFTLNVQVENVLPEAEPARVELGLAGRAERCVEAVGDSEIKAVAAMNPGQVPVPAGYQPARAGSDRIIHDLADDQR